MASRRRATHEIEGLDIFVRELRRAGSEWGAEMRTANKETADFVADGGRAELSASGHPVLAYVAGLRTAIKGKRDGRKAIVVIDARSKRNAPALGAELGSHAFAQFPKYRDAKWKRGLPTGGYGVHVTIRDDIDEIVELYEDKVTSLYRRAFPD